jgi:hypothetical protein
MASVSGEGLQCRQRLGLGFLQLVEFTQVRLDFLIGLEIEVAYSPALGGQGLQGPTVRSGQEKRISQGRQESYQGCYQNVQAELGNALQEIIVGYQNADPELPLLPQGIGSHPGPPAFPLGLVTEYGLA